jgi:glycosyltransferase involved in cell wall biosynthesis
MDGVAATSRHFEAFARNRELQFLTVHAGRREEIVDAGSTVRIALPRGPLTLPLDHTHHYDFAFWRHYKRVAGLVRDFDPDVLQITGPSDVGMLGALIAHKLRVPLAANWQTNLHQYARSRLSSALPLVPKALSPRLLSAVERWALRAAVRFYKIPRLLFAPNSEMVAFLSQATGRSCYLMPHSVDSAVFSPGFRDRGSSPFRIGYVGRLTTEKNVRFLAKIEDGLLSRGHKDFRIVVVGDGAEGKWLRKNMRQAEFTGVLTGRDLSRAYANMDLFVFPSETDTFGLAVLEAFASGVPAVVSSLGGPKDTVQHAKTGYIARNPEEFIAFTELLFTRPELLRPMGLAARSYALSTSWDRTFEAVYKTYAECFYGPRSSLEVFIPKRQSRVCGEAIQLKD